MKKNVFLFLAIPVMIFLHGCENQEPAPVDLELFISPDTLLIDDQDTEREVFISTKPRGKCNFTVTQKPDWLTVTPLKGEIDGQMFPLTISPKISGLGAGIYKGDISIISDIGGSSEICVFLTVAEHPQIKLNPASINIPENVNNAELTIQNTGTGSLVWFFSESPGWLSFSATSGTLPAGTSRVVAITCKRTGLDAATHTGRITINSNSEVAVQPISVSMAVPAITTIEVPENLLFAELTGKLNIVVKNTGNIQISWTALQGNYLTLSTSGGTLGKGESQTIEVSVNRTSLATGTFESYVTFNYGSGGTMTVPVQIKHFIPTKWGIEGTVKDAEFCIATNRIILVTSNPDRLLVVDPEAKTIESISLHSLPKCVAVNKAGDRAVIGHDGMITYVSITGMTIEKESPVGCDVLDIVLTSAGWVYAFPVRDQWTRIICINPLTGVSSQHTGNLIYAGTLGKLHPSEKWIYGANNGLSPSDIEKYNIENGTAVFSYDSPYHGNYPMNGNLWFSEDGQRIFTRGRTVLRTSSDKASDMVYNGSLPTTKDIWTLFHSGLSDKIFFTTFTRGAGYNEIIPASEISVCNYTYLTFLKTYPLEKFIVPDNTSGSRLCNAEGYYVFANREGTKLYAVIRADKTSGLLNDWAIQNVNID